MKRAIELIRTIRLRITNTDGFWPMAVDFRKQALNSRALLNSIH
jgi:hypothetical protein